MEDTGAVLWTSDRDQEGRRAETKEAWDCTNYFLEIENLIQKGADFTLNWLDYGGFLVIRSNGGSYEFSSV